MLTIYRENPLPAEVMQVGAAKYLSKAAAPHEVICAIRAVNATSHRDIAQQMGLS